MTILVTGANGQLGQTIKSVAGNYKALDFVFTSKSNLDITDSEAVTRIFNKKNLITVLIVQHIPTLTALKRISN
jgi:dTDP-4-dehydrorhamnose reductase (EC 1.1.1.133)